MGRRECQIGLSGPYLLDEVALAISAPVFREWADLNAPRVLAGACLIVTGAVVVATAYG